MIWFLTTIQQGILFAATIFFIGCVTWRTLIAPDVAGTLEDGRFRLGRTQALVVRWARSSCAALILAWNMRLLVQVIAFRDPFAPIWDDISLLLFQTVWGKIWMLQGVVIALIASTLTWGLPTGNESGKPPPTQVTPAWVLLSGLTIALTSTLAMSGHAMGADSWRWIAVSADVLHTLSAGIWMGSLAVIIGASHQGPKRTASDTQAFGAQIQRFSTLALRAGLAVVLMGVVLTWTHLSSPSDLWMTGYGRVLSSKVIVVTLIFGLGFWNWRKGVPISESESGMRMIQRRGSWELILAAGVIFLTAILVHSVKP